MAGYRGATVRTGRGRGGRLAAQGRCDGGVRCNEMLVAAHAERQLSGGRKEVVVLGVGLAGASLVMEW